MARGGWRYGAGRPGASIKAEQALRLDVRELGPQRLQDGANFTWHWANSVTGETVGSISVQTAPASMRLSFAVGISTMVQVVPILKTACHLGGHRFWLACPRCDDRVAVLYLRSGSFRCRRCNVVRYSSQSEGDLSRVWRKQRKLEARFGPNLNRPKGMHLRTYVGLLDRFVEFHAVREAAIHAAIHRMGLWAELGL